MQYEYKATITSVYDGDTVTADVDLGFCITLRKIKMRLAGINTPELRGVSDEEKAKAIKSRDWLREKILNQEVKVISHGKGKYGRWVVNIYKDQVDINQSLIDEGLAVPFMEK